MKRKLSEKQKHRLRELKERNEAIAKLVVERIDRPEQALPLNLILESRFNAVMVNGIELEGELAYLRKDTSEAAEKQTAVTIRRLDIVRGQLNELESVGDMLRKYDEMGRVFEIVRK